MSESKLGRKLPSCNTLPLRRGLEQCPREDASKLEMPCYAETTLDEGSSRLSGMDPIGLSTNSAVEFLSYREPEK